MRIVLLTLAFAVSASAQITVTSTGDTVLDDGLCTLREAITSANSGVASGAQSGECVPSSGPDVISFGVPAGSDIVLTSALPSITESLTLEGPTGAAAGLAINGDGQFKVLDFGGTDQTYRLSGVTLTGGQSMFGAGITFSGTNTCAVEDVAVTENMTTNFAGGVYVGSGMTCAFERVLIADNESGGSGGGLQATRGSSVTFRNSTVVGNTAGGPGGGLVAFFNLVAAGRTGDFLLEQSTISGNVSGGRGGGVWFIGPQGTFAMRSTAVVDNESVGDLAGTGGAALNGDALVVSSVVAGNRSGQPDPGFTDLSADNGAVSGGGNLVGIGAGASFPSGMPNANGDLVGEDNAPLGAGLAALADYGGPLPTHLPLIGSPVLDAGRCPVLDQDQRGEPRERDEPSIPDVGGDACDIGPVEGTVNAVSAEAPAASALRLGAPSPNPTRGAVRLTYAVGTAGAVSLTVTDVLGRTVAVLAEGRRAAGEHRAVLDTAALAPGVFVARLTTASGTAARAFTVVR